jgi:hypothetical protein
MRNRFCAAVISMVAVMTATGANADIKPALRMEFQVQESSLSDVMKILTRYAKKEGFTVEDVGPHMPPKDNRPIFYVNLTRQDSTEITVTNFLKQNQMLLAFYVPKQDTQSQHLIDPLISELREKWPDIHVYTGL